MSPLSNSPFQKKVLISINDSVHESFRAFHETLKQSPGHSRSPRKASGNGDGFGFSEDEGRGSDGSEVARTHSTVEAEWPQDITRAGDTASLTVPELLSQPAPRRSNAHYSFMPFESENRPVVGTSIASAVPSTMQASSSGVLHHEEQEVGNDLADSQGEAEMELESPIWDTITLPSVPVEIPAGEQDAGEASMEVENEGSIGIRSEEYQDGEGGEYEGEGEGEGEGEDEYEERYQDEEGYEGEEQYEGEGEYEEEVDRDGSVAEDDREGGSPPLIVFSPPLPEGMRLEPVQEEEEEEEAEDEERYTDDRSLSGRGQAAVAESTPLQPFGQPFSLPSAFSFTFTPHPGPILDEVRQGLRGTNSGGVTLSRQQVEDFIGRLDEVSESLRGTDDELVTVRNELLDLIEGSVDNGEEGGLV